MYLFRDVIVQTVVRKKYLLREHLNKILNEEKSFKLTSLEKKKEKKYLTETNRRCLKNEQEIKESKIWDLGLPTINKTMVFV